MLGKVQFCSRKAKAQSTNCQQKTSQRLELVKRLMTQTCYAHRLDACSGAAPGRPIGTRNRTYDAKNCSRRRRRKSRTMRNRVLSHLPRSPDERFWDGGVCHGNTRERAEVARCRCPSCGSSPWRQPSDPIGAELIRSRAATWAHKHTHHRPALLATMAALRGKATTAPTA